VRGGGDDARAGELCADAMRIATSLAHDVVVLPGIDQSPSGASALPVDEALAQLEHSAADLEQLRRAHRIATLGAVADGGLTADTAMVRVDALRSLQALTQHAWRSTVHLVDRGK